MGRRLLGIMGAAFIVASAGGCSCGGGGQDSPDTDGGVVVPAEPQLPGIALVYPESTSTVHVHWAPASDDETAHEELTYLVYQGDSVDAVTGSHARGDAPVATLIGGTSYTATGLAPDQPVAFTLVAVDADGNESAEAAAQGISSLPRDPVIANAPKDLRDDNVTEIDRDEYVISGATANTVESGNIVIIPNSKGRWLRKVETVDPDPNGLRITTSSAVLADVFSDAVLRTRATAVEVPDDASASRGGKRSADWASTYAAPNGVIRIEELGRAHPFADSRQSKGEGNVQLEVGVTYAWRAAFTPSWEIETEINEADPDAEKTHMEISGVFDFYGKAGYFYEGTASYQTKKELFSRTVTLRYAVGGVPVVQDVRLTFFAELALDASATFKVDSILQATKEIKIVVDYDPQTGWSMNTEDGFERTIDFVVDGHTTASANLKISAEVATSFYKAAEAKVTIRPTLDLQAAARFQPTPVEMTKFDVLFWVDVWADASLTILGRELGSWRSDTYQLLKIPLFTLPELRLNESIKVSTCRSKKMFLGVTHGYNNPVPAENIEWELLDAPSNATLDIVAPTSMLVAETGADSDTTYKVRVSAHGSGFLGTLGTRYATLDVTVAEPDGGMCDPNEPEFSESDIIGCDAKGVYGLIGHPTLSHTKITSGEFLEISLPVYCPDCWMSSNLTRYDPGLGQQICLYGNDGCDRRRTYNDGSEPIVDRTQIYVGNPGIYYPTVGFNSAFNGGGASTSYFIPAFDPNAPQDSYTVFQSSPTGPMGAWSCEEGSGVPIPFVELVAGNASDGNRTPDDAVTLRINDGSIGNRHTWTPADGDTDDDWYEIDLDPELAYDTLFGYSPTCELTICVEAKDGTAARLPLLVFGDKAKAEAGAPVLASTDYGCTAVTAEEGQKLYVRTRRDGLRKDDGRDYAITVTSDCDASFTSSLPLLAGAPQLSAPTVAAGGSIDVTLPLNLLVAEARIILRRRGSTASGSSYVTVSGLLGQPFATTSLPVSASASGEYVLWVELRYPGTSDGSSYEEDPAQSDTMYQVIADKRDDVGTPLGIVRFVSAVPLATVMVTP